MLGSNDSQRHMRYTTPHFEWCDESLLTPEAWAVYRQAHEEARAAYEREHTPIWYAMLGAQAPFRDEYDLFIEHPSAVIRSQSKAQFYAQCEPSNATYHAAQRPAWARFEAACKAAFEICMTMSKDSQCLPL